MVLGNIRRLVIIESPYAGEVERNLAYLKRAMLDSLSRGEAPFASHAMYNGVLNDDIEFERALGLDAGLAWAAQASLSAIYMDHGISRGMEQGIAHARLHGRTIVYRLLYPNPRESLLPFERNE
jgi:hypothetical protein